jgi:hypothetical protein
VAVAPVEGDVPRIVWAKALRSPGRHVADGMRPSVVDGPHGGRVDGVVVPGDLAVDVEVDVEHVGANAVATRVRRLADRHVDPAGGCPVTRRALELVLPAIARGRLPAPGGPGLPGGRPAGNRQDRGNEPGHGPQRQARPAWTHG